MAYNNGREDRKWRIWKEAEEKILREHGVDETTTPQIRIDDRADFNSNRRFYHWTYRVLYIRMPDLMRNFENQSDNLRELTKYRKRIGNYQILILDEWLNYKLTEKDAKNLYELFEQRSGNNSTIFVESVI